MGGPRLEFICYRSFEDLPPEVAEVFSLRWNQEYFLQPRWYNYLVSHFLQTPEEFCVWLGRSAEGVPAMLFPARRTLAEPKAMGALALHAASHWENTAPMGLMFNEGVAPADYTLTAFLTHLKTAKPYGEKQPFDVLRFWPLDKDSEMAWIIYKSLRKAGYWMQPYKNSLNQFETVEGQDFETYFEGRSYNFRYNLRRRRRKLEREHELTFDYYVGTEGLDQGLREYETISWASWKKPQSMLGPVYYDLIHDSMAAGVGRLSTMKLDGKPVSTQFWIVSDGVGHIIRLAYDKDYEKQAVGIVHNAEMIRHVMNEGGIKEINYGYGGEQSKVKWTRQSRVLYGVMAFNPKTRKGFYFALKNIVGSFVKQRTIAPIRDYIEKRRRGEMPPGARAASRTR